VAIGAAGSAMTWAPMEGSRRGTREVARGETGLAGGDGVGDRGRQRVRSTG
jgi:hypothetical protein